MMLWRRQADPEARSRARDQARWLIRDHGDDAERVLEEKLRRRSSTYAMREIYRLTRRELRVLRRYQEREPRPPSFWDELVRGVRSLFCRKRRRRRRHRR